MEIVYGRRRIGKTFLVRQFFDNKFTFSFVGGHGESTKEQLTRFALAQQEQWHLPIVPQFSNWREAFHSLRQLLLALPDKERKVIFLDEMPWMDTPKSRFITALEAFWNGWAAARDDIMLVACGSSTSWMVEKILGNQGGLFGRVTEQIYLRPFNLKECEQLIESKHGQWDRYQITQAYMALGGVPFYFDMLDSNQSVAQILIDSFLRIMLVWQMSLTNFILPYSVVPKTIFLWLKYLSPILEVLHATKYHH